MSAFQFVFQKFTCLLCWAVSVRFYVLLKYVLRSQQWPVQLVLEWNSDSNGLPENDGSPKIIFNIRK